MPPSHQRNPVLYWFRFYIHLRQQDKAIWKTVMPLARINISTWFSLSWCKDFYLLKVHIWSYLHLSDAFIFGRPFLKGCHKNVLCAAKYQDAGMFSYVSVQLPKFHLTSNFTIITVRCITTLIKIICFLS